MSYHHDRTNLCPVTGEERTDTYKECWTDRAFSDEPFNRCPKCCPEGYVPMGTRLRRLENDRRNAPEHP